MVAADWVWMLISGLLAITPASPHKVPVATPDYRAMDEAYRAGQAHFENGEFLAAARRWTESAEKLPERAEYRKERERIYKEVAEAYDKARLNGASEAVVRQAFEVLDLYVSGYLEAYPGDTPHARTEEVRAVLRKQLDELDASEAARRAELVAKETLVRPTPQTPTPPPRPWRGLVIGGGALVGSGVAMLGAVIGGAVLARNAERYVEAPTSMCYLPLTSTCADQDARGRAGNGVTIVGAVAAPLMLGTGIGMLVVGMRRKAGRSTLTPQIGATEVGFVWTVHL